MKGDSIVNAAEERRRGVVAGRLDELRVMIKESRVWPEKEQLKRLEKLYKKTRRTMYGTPGRTCIDILRIKRGLIADVLAERLNMDLHVDHVTQMHNSIQNQTNRKDASRTRWISRSS